MSIVKKTASISEDTRSWGIDIDYTKRQGTARTQIGNKMTKELIRLKDILALFSADNQKVIHNFFIAVQAKQMHTTVDKLELVIPGDAFDTLDTDKFDPDPKHMAHYKPPKG